METFELELLAEAPFPISTPNRCFDELELCPLFYPGSHGESDPRSRAVGAEPDQSEPADAVPDRVGCVPGPGNSSVCTGLGVCEPTGSVETRPK